jgi:hypothetical protein
MNGTNEEDNIAYLTIKEHILAHFLLWKIHNNVNDLRAMKMLGGKLSREYRKKIGKFCFDNKIGMHGVDTETKKLWKLKGIKTQMETKVGIFNPKNTKMYASIGGKASIKSKNNPWHFWTTKEGRLIRGSMGGKAHKGKKCMHIPGSNTFIRAKIEDVEKYKKEGYVLGSPIKPHLGKKGKPSPRRKMVSDGIITYNSIHEAAEKNLITPGAVIYRCKSKKSNWHYIS